MKITHFCIAFTSLCSSSVEGNLRNPRIKSGVPVILALWMLRLNNWPELPGEFKAILNHKIRSYLKKKKNKKKTSRGLRDGEGGREGARKSQDVCTCATSP